MTKTMRIAALAVTLLLLGGNAGAQVASRPAADWVKVLDTAERLEAMRIGDVVARLGLRPGDVVADLGAGSGPFVVPFAKAVTPGGKVYAVEIDRDFFPYIRERAAQAGVTNVSTVLGAFTDPALPGADIDVAFMHDVLHHVADRAAYLSNLVTYLAPGARIAVIDYHPSRSPHAGEPALQVDKTQAAAWLAPAGFTPVEDIALFDDKWFVIFARQK